ncbi:hypothetical protein TrCOL_g9571 [Triparma columacea]|uniref:Ubiquitin-like domain-containing protein n=1 Tax=Triparma columacea TaxID=722753 RepID=A0A9W7LE58_9STRA|nr:hypothetical protein TrCOL_g9571 [Triparma columacea]
MKLLNAFVALAAVLNNVNGETYTITLRGKRIPLVGKDLTVKDVKAACGEASPGLKEDDMTVLCSGEKLSEMGSKLSECGVEDGGVINVVPKKKKKAKKAAPVPSTASVDAASGASSLGGGMDDLLKGFGAGGGEGMDDIMKQVAAMQGAKDPVEMLRLMQKMLKSPAVSGYLNDPAKIEQARQMVISNPMLKTMVSSSLPGFDEILGSKERWAETMVAARDMYLNMGEEEIKMMAKMMEGQMGKSGPMGGPMGGGMGGGMESSDQSLDELDED